MVTWYTGKHCPEVVSDIVFPGQINSDVVQNYGQSIISRFTGISDMVLHSGTVDEEINVVSLPDASGDDYYTVLSSQWTDYFSGILQNIGDTEYMCYCLRDYASSSSYSYTDYYILVYDLELDEDENIVAGSYPYMSVYRSSNNNGYTVEEGATSSVVVPVPAYGSFGSLSELRKDGGINETYAILFALVVAFVYSIAHDIFDFVLQLGKR